MTRLSGIHCFALIVGFVVISSVFHSIQAQSRELPKRMAHAPPVLTTDLPPRPMWLGSRGHTFTVTASDPQGGLINLVLLNPPPGALFTPARHHEGEAQREFRWFPEIPGHYCLVFEAFSDTRPQLRTRREVAIDVVTGPFVGKTLTGDVNGDGVLDFITASKRDGQGLDFGAAFVWFGGKFVEGVADVRMMIPETLQGDMLTETLGTEGDPGLFVLDVNGDKFDDIVAVAALANDVGNAADSGAVFVWLGSDEMASNPLPSAILRHSDPAFFDYLGGAADGQVSVTFRDLTGDGIREIIVVAPFMDVDGLGDSGAVYVWEGGPGLVGEPDPLAILKADPHDRFPSGGPRSAHVADYDGDGFDDLLFVNSRWDGDKGAIFFWRGGPGLSGTPLPTAVFTVSDPGTLLGRMDNEPFPTLRNSHSLYWRDITGDGQRELIVGACYADIGGETDTGAIFVYDFAPTTSGIQLPLATLTVPGASEDDFESLPVHALKVFDATGDGINDVLLSAPLADHGGLTDSGAAYVWAGDASLSGTLHPHATLSAPGAAGSEEFGGQAGIFRRDISGDGQPEILLAAPFDDHNGGFHVGLVYVWSCGSSLVGNVAPAATLAPPTNIGLQLGSGGLQAIKFGDVTADGIEDVVIGSARADVGVANSGAIYVWAGGPGAVSGTSSQTAILFAPNPTDSLQLTDRVGFELVDVTGDGILDIVSGSPWADVGTVVDQGAAFVWNGGPALSGTLVPDSTLLVEGAENEDNLGRNGSSAPGIAFADVTEDGCLDIVISAYRKRIDGCLYGSVYLWVGGESLGTGSDVSADAWLRVRPAQRRNGDSLTSVTRGVGMQLADVTGDGRLDLLAGASSANHKDVTDCGAFYLWKDLRKNSAFPNQILEDPVLSNHDRLGE